MLVLNPAGTDSLLLTGANDAQLFAYSVSRFQTVSLPPVTLFFELGLCCHRRHVQAIQTLHAQLTAYIGFAWSVLQSKRRLECACSSSVGASPHGVCLGCLTVRVRHG